MPASGDIRVTALAIAPVKGMRLLARERIDLDRDGARDNRRFYVIDERDRMVNGKTVGELTTVTPDYDHAQRRLTLRFADGTEVADAVRPGPSVTARFFSRPAEGRLVLGPWSQALSTLTGRSLRLVEANGGRVGVDRGRVGAASLISSASLAHLAGVAARDAVDARRFRMLVEVEGTEPYAEDAWVGSAVRIGAAVVRMHGHVGRCLVTSRHPETGEIDLPTLDLLASYRDTEHTSEPLAFGIYGEVVQGGRVRLGDPVEPI